MVIFGMRLKGELPEAEPSQCTSPEALDLQPVGELGNGAEGSEPSTPYKFSDTCKELLVNTSFGFRPVMSNKHQS